MENLPNKFVLSVAPKEYLKQGPSHCGMYSVKGILSAYNRDTHRKPEDYHQDYRLNLLGKTTGTTLPWAIPQVLRKYGLQAKLQFAHGSKAEKIKTLKSLLSRDNPVILLIGSGYREHGSYSSFRAKIVLHWITLWGYDDTEKVFFVYDSEVPEDQHDKSIPIGNKKRSYDNVIRDWGAGIISFGFWKYLYIPVTKQ